MKLAIAAVAILLAAIGIVASLGRAIFPTDLAARLDVHRQRVLHDLDRDDPFLPGRAAELARFDGRFASHPVVTLLHVAPGGLFLLLAPLQFVSRLRTRHPGFHRWSGRLLVASAATAASTGLYFGLFVPFGGAGESVAIALFGGLLLHSLGKAVVAIRLRDVASHREWMIRAAALCLAVSSVRIVGAVLDLTLTTAGLPPDRPSRSRSG